MPTKGKCWSCGEFAYLTGRLLQNLDDGHMELIAEEDKKRENQA